MTTEEEAAKRWREFLTRLGFPPDYVPTDDQILLVIHAKKRRKKNDKQKET